MLKSSFELMDEDMDNFDAAEQGAQWNRARGAYGVWQYVLELLSTK